MYRVLVGVSGRSSESSGSIWMMWSDLNSAGGETRRSLSRPGVLGSDGSWEEDLRGRVCSEPPPESMEKK